MTSMRQTIFLSCVAVAASQYNYQQFLHRGEVDRRDHVAPNYQASNEHQYNWHQYLPESDHSAGQQYDWHQYVHKNNAQNDWHQYADGGNHSNMGQYDWHQYVHRNNASNNQRFDWHRYVHSGNTSSGQEFNWHKYVPQGNFSAESNYNGPQDANNATTVDELNVWREHTQTQIHRFVPQPYRNVSMVDVDSEYQQNLNRINGVAATEAPAVAATEAPAVAATEAPAVAATEEASVASVEAPAIAVAPHATATEAVVLAESPLRQASPLLLMFALLAGAAVFAIAVGSRNRHGRGAREPLLPTEYTVLP